MGGLGTEVEPNSEAVPKVPGQGIKYFLCLEFAEGLQSRGGKPEKRSGRW